MSKVLTIAKWTAALGRDPQNFLGARWISPFLERVPGSGQRKWALRILAMSPHYFFDPDRDDFQKHRDLDALEASFDEVTRSRILIYDNILKPHLTPSDRVLDYGCGPGFMAKAISKAVSSVTAIDISPGAIACARILNSDTNIEYHVAKSETFDMLRKQRFDTIYSYAVVQHVTDEVLRRILSSCSELIKPGGRLLLHVQLPDDVWRTEADWRNDQSIKGKLRFRYGLHCFARTEEEYNNFLADAGFEIDHIENISDLIHTGEKELEQQRLIVARATGSRTDG
ncbi:MAG TPA: methyltransferase domain-containing protein [Pyrinomonadaceae bacterium]|nr:methyltransferase domain-containing protein [Pyrinomonadaceae bacterium]